MFDSRWSDIDGNWCVFWSYDSTLKLYLTILFILSELVSMSALTKLAQNNMAMLTSGLESVWELIRGNASLVFSAFLTVFSLVFSHSFALFNFCFSMVSQTIKLYYKLVLIQFFLNKARLTI